MAQGEREWVILNQAFHSCSSMAAPSRNRDWLGIASGSRKMRASAKSTPRGQKSRDSYRPIHYTHCLRALLVGLSDIHPQFVAIIAVKVQTGRGRVNAPGTPLLQNVHSQLYMCSQDTVVLLRDGLDDLDFLFPAFKLVPLD